MRMTEHGWFNLLVDCQVKPTVAATWASVFAAVVDDSTFSAGAKEIDDFLGQVLHESNGLQQMEEGLSYSAERLTVVWPRRFPTLESAAQFARNPEALANKVYGGRMGNTEPGDGYKYRGRGIIQITGKENYKLVSDILGIDIVTSPDKLAEPETALRAAIAWWEDRIPDSAMGDTLAITKRVNGGTLGLAHRQELTAKANQAIGEANDMA